MGRVIAAQLTERLGQTVIVDNRGAGGGIIGINATAKSPADGYTVLLVSVGYPVSIALGRMPLESLQWFAPVASVATGPSLLVVPSALPVNSVMDLVALAKQKPGELNAGAAGPGSFQHLATELFRLQAGIDIVIVQYKGGGPALTDTIAGQVHMNVGSVIQNLPHVRSGQAEGARHRRHQAYRGAARGAHLRRGGRARRRSEQLVGDRSAGRHARPRRSAACSRKSPRSSTRAKRASASSWRAPRRCA